MTNIYQPPQSDVQIETVAGEQYGSIENALAGNYDLEIGAVLKEAWEKTKGMKGSVIGAGLLFYAVSFAVSLIPTGLVLLLSLGQDSYLPMVFQVVLTIITMPMTAGFFMIGIRRSVGQPFSFSMIFQYFGFIIPIILVTLLMYVLVVVGFVLLVIPGIYLSVGYAFAMMLVVEKKMGIWEALETSRKAVTKRWFTFFLLYILIILIILVSMLPIGIGLIWTMPMSVACYGITYRNLFGVEPISEQ